LIGAVNVITEVGSQRETEAIRARLAAIVQCSDDAIISKSLDGRIESWNDGAERLFGYTAEEAIGQPITLIIPHDRRSEEREILAKLTRGERIDHLETERITKSGQRLFVSLTTSPLRDPSGRVVGASKVARDITARKQGERAIAALSELRASQLADLARLRDMTSRLWTAQELRPILEETLRTAAAIDGTDLGLVWMWDRGGAHLELGASLGFNPGLLEEVDHVPVGPGVSARSCAEGRRVIVGDVDEVPDFEPFGDAMRAAGVRALHCTPLLTRSRQVVGVLMTCFRRPHRPSAREMDLMDLCVAQAVDFIENAQLHGRLRDADERKNQFLAILAHELRNPLAPVRNALELIRRDPSDAAMMQRSIGMMDRQVRHLVRLIDDLMDVSRITRGQFALRREPTTLATVLETALETCRVAIDAAGHRLTISLPSDAVGLDADPTRLAQVFSNLIGNAAKYTPGGGRIWLEAERRGTDRVIVRVRDNGVGIPPAAIGSIFEIFTQVGDALERPNGGLGIGLSLVRGLVEMHGGSVTARSAGLGRGSEFTVELPALPIALPAPAASGGAPERTAVAPCRILIVDDNEDAAASLSMLIQRRDHVTRVAHDGAEAVRVAAEFRPDIAFLDIGLPKLNGYEVGRAIRSQAWGRAVFLIALTGWGQDEDKRLAAESGFDLHLVKPIDPSSLDDLIRSARRRQGGADAAGAGPGRREP
jgi:PAS domain S-box-containing protein